KFNKYLDHLDTVSDDWDGHESYHISESGRLQYADLHITGIGTIAFITQKYTDEGWLDTVTRFDGSENQIITTYGHDDAGRLTSITHEQYNSSTLTTTSLSDFAYTL